MKGCVGIICIGRTYIQEFEELFKPSVESYCQRHGYDLKVFTNFLESERNYPQCISFQKMLIPIQDCMKKYDLVIILDADIYIMKDAPPISINDKIGMVNELSQVSSAEFHYLLNQKVLNVPSEYYAKEGFSLSNDYYLNSGVIVCNPAIHGPIFKTIYDTYVDRTLISKDPLHCEQACVGGYLLTHNLVSCIPNEWNHIYSYDKLLNRKIGSTYFLHFAGIKSSQRRSMLRTFLLMSQMKVGI